MTILVVGGGKMGMSHLALITQYVGKSNVALCERNIATRLLFRFLGYKVFASADKAHQRLAKLSGLLIATPTPSHAPLADWAIKRKLPFFVEKPLTLDAERSAGLVTAAESAGVEAQVGFVLRYVASFQRLRALVAEERLGRLHGYCASMLGNVITAPLPAESWQGDFARGGGCLNEYGPHIIDLCRFIFGTVETVTGADMGRVHSQRADDWVKIDWIHASSIPGQLNINWCDASKRKSVIEFVARFEHADVRVDNSAVEITWKGSAPLSELERAEIDGPVKPFNVGYYLRGEEFSLEIETFLETCLGRRFHIDPTLPSNTTPRLSDGLEVDRLIDSVATKASLK